MSSLVAQQVAATAPERVASLVLLTPVAPTGMGAPEARVGYLETMTMDDTMRREALASQWGERVSQRWLEVKLRRWSEAALPHASRGYVRMFATTAVSGTPRPDLPVLAVVGDCDNEPFLEKTVRQGLESVYRGSSSPSARTPATTRWRRRRSPSRASSSAFSTSTRIRQADPPRRGGRPEERTGLAVRC